MSGSTDTGPCNAAQGVYFSGNDAVLDWCIAFLNSFRQTNPSLALSLIPFDVRCERLKGLADTYDFTVHEDEAFPRLEEIGRRLDLGHTPYGPHWFRRYAAFWGPYEDFLYLDARQVVLAPLSRFVTAPRDFGFDLVHYDVAIDQVYQPGPLRQMFLRTGGASGFNSGRWASRRGLFDIEDFEALCEEALRVREQLNPRNTDQAFINYCCDMRGMKSANVASLLGDMAESSWAGQRGGVYVDESGCYRLWDHGGIDHRKRLILLNWAGISGRRGLPHAKIFYRFLHARRNSVGRIVAMAGGVLGATARSLLFGFLQLRGCNLLVKRAAQLTTKQVDPVQTKAQP